LNIKTELACKYRGREYWYAYDDDSYDGTANSYMASGSTEAEAIQDLIDNGPTE